MVFTSTLATPVAAKPDGKAAVQGKASKRRGGAKAARKAAMRKPPRRGSKGAPTPVLKPYKVVPKTTPPTPVLSPPTPLSPVVTPKDPGVPLLTPLQPDDPTAVPSVPKLLPSGAAAGPAAASPAQANELLPQSGSPAQANELLPHSGSPAQANELLPQSGSPVQAKELLPQSGSPVQAKELLPQSGSPAQANVLSPAADKGAPEEVLLARQRFSRLQGDRGTAHVDAATLLDRYETILSFSSTYGRGSAVFLPADAESLQVQTFALNYGAWDFLQLGMNFTLATATNTVDPDPTAASLGDPHLRAKGRLIARRNWGLSGILDLGIPTAAQGAGLKLNGSAIEIGVAGSWLPLSWLETNLNLGAVLDGRNKIFDAATYSRVRLFSGGAPVSTRVNFGLSAAALFSFSQALDLGPFLELSGAYGIGAPTKQDPMLLSLGVKVAPQRSRRWEFGIGADVRLAGAPERDKILAKMPGALPWTLMGFGAVHFEAAETACAAATDAMPVAQACLSDADCGAGMLCLAQSCQSSNFLPAYALQGNVVAAGSELPIRDAVLRLSSMPQIRYVTDREGAFATPPLQAPPSAVGESPLTLTVEATDYAPQTQPVMPPRDGKPLQLRVTLQPAETLSDGAIKGVVLDKVTGKALREGFIFLPTLQQRLPINARGEFAGTLRVGRHQVLIYAKGYVTQRKDVTIHRDDLVIFNIDLTPSSTAN